MQFFPGVNIETTSKTVQTEFNDKAISTRLFIALCCLDELPFKC